MLKKKFGLVLGLMIVMAVISSPINVYATGICTCEKNAVTGLVEPITGATCSSDETATCGANGIGTDVILCSCKAKATTLSVNTCSCSNGVSTASNCQGSTTVTKCTGANTCECTSGATPIVTTVAEGSSYNPFNGCSSTSINSALGCIPSEMNAFIPWLLTWLFGVAGGIAFLLMAYGFILIATSAGDEKKVQGAKETITSAIIGLVVCVFAIFILRLIAVNILKIPGIN
jgi:hypothetical protein